MQELHKQRERAEKGNKKKRKLKDIKMQLRTILTKFRKEGIKKENKVVRKELWRN